MIGALDAMLSFNNAKDNFAIEYFKSLPESIKNDKKFVLEFINETHLSILHFLNYDLRNDREIVKSSTFYGDADALQYASEELKKDDEFMKSIVRTLPKALKYASDNVKNNKEFVIGCIKERNGEILEFSGEIVRNDKEIIIAALNKRKDIYNHSRLLLDTFYLKFLGEKLKSDKDFLLSIIEMDGSALQYASEELKNDKDFVLRAYEINHQSLQYVGKSLLSNDKDIIKLVVRRYGNLFEYVNENLKKDKKFIFELLAEGNSSFIQFIDNTLKDDKVFMMQVMKKAVVTEYLSDSLKNDVDIAALAAQTNGFCYIGERLRANKAAMMYLLTSVNYITYDVIRYASDTLKKDKEFILTALRRFPSDIVLKNVSEEFRKDKDIIIAAIKQGPESIRLIDECLKNDPDVLMEIDKLYSRMNQNYQLFQEEPNLNKVVSEDDDALGSFSSK